MCAPFPVSVTPLLPRQEETQSRSSGAGQSPVAGLIVPHNRKPCTGALGKYHFLDRSYVLHVFIRRWERVTRRVQHLQARITNQTALSATMIHESELTVLRAHAGARLSRPRAEL